MAYVGVLEKKHHILVDGQPAGGRLLEVVSWRRHPSRDRIAGIARTKAGSDAFEVPLS